MKLDDGVFEVFGIVQSSHTWSPASGIGVYVGNVEREPLVQSYATSNEEGAFSFVIDHRPQQQPYGISGSGILLWRVAPAEQAPKKYLYLGRARENLMRYEIPYNLAKKP